MCHGAAHARFRCPAAVEEAGSAAEVQHVLPRSPPERPCGYSSMVSWPHPNVRSVSRNFGNIAGSLSYGAIGDSPPARPRCHCRPGIISLHLRGSRWISQRIDGGNWWKKPKRAKALEDTCVPNGKPVTHLPSSCLAVVGAGVLGMAQGEGKLHR